MNNLVILPIIIPLLTGIFLLFFPKRITLQKWVSGTAVLATACISVYLVYTVSVSGIQVVQLGGWEAPFGISFVADMFAALLVLTTSIVSLCCLLYAYQSISERLESFYFYAFVLVLISGVNGSFLTGDLFNLFVCFEVMLISSYVLLGLGGTKNQLRESVKYVLVNLLSSMLFIVAISFLYGITGTLNMADLSLRIAEAGQDGLLTTVSLLFLTVFSIKAALFLYFWLPGSYEAPPAAVAALFGALLTKVGIYAIFRMFTLVFYHQPEITHTLIIWMAAVTMILGAVGAIAYWDVKKIIVYNVIFAVGFILFGVGVFTSTTMMGALYYLLHDMVVKALLFILGGVIIHIACSHKLEEMSGLIRHHPYIGWLFFITAFAVAGIPPLSGFVGKVLLTQGALEEGFYLVAGISLFMSLLILYSLMKIFFNGFWGETTLSKKNEGKVQGVFIPCTVLAALSVFMGLGAESIFGYVEQAVAVFIDPSLYIQAVLNPQS